MSLWMLLSLGGAISSLVLGMERFTLAGLAQKALSGSQGDSESARDPTDIYDSGTAPEEEEVVVGQELTLVSLADFIGTSEADTLYVELPESTDPTWHLAERTGLENLIAGHDGDLAWFHPDEARSDPEAGIEDARLTDGVMYLDAGAGDDFISINGPGAIDLYTGEGADTVVVGEGTGYIALHANSGDSVYLADDYEGQVWVSGEASVQGGAGRDMVHIDANSAGAWIHTGGGDDCLITDGGGILNGNDGNDTIKGFGSDAVLRGGRGDDVILSYGSNMSVGGDGADEIYLGEGYIQYEYAGSGEGMSTFTRLDTHAFATNEAADSVFGGEGDDVIHYIGAGDWVSGGSGADYFDVVGDGRAVIDDFEVGQDFLNLSATGGTLIEHGDATIAGELTSAELDTLLQNDASYQLDNRVTLVKNTFDEKTLIAIDNQIVVELTGLHNVTVGYRNGGDDTLYDLTGAAILEADADVIVQVYQNIRTVSLVG